MSQLESKFLLYKSHVGMIICPKMNRKAKWIAWIESKIRLPFSDLVNVVVLIVSILALIIAGISLRVSIDSLKSAETSGADQQKVLESSRKALEAVVGKLNIQTQLQMKQYKETLRRPEVRAYLWNFKDKVQLIPEIVEIDEKTQTVHSSGRSLPFTVKLKSDANGRAFFDVIIENAGDRDLMQANISVGCDVPMETYSLGETGRSAPANPDSGNWRIDFTKTLLNPFKQSGRGAVYEFSTRGPFPKVFLPRKLFGCSVVVHAPGLTPFVSGAFLQVVD
jgi:hypothetical protein